jgi:hypothetical protein
LLLDEIDAEIGQFLLFAHSENIGLSISIKRTIHSSKDTKWFQKMTR